MPRQQELGQPNFLPPQAATEAIERSHIGSPLQRLLLGPLVGNTIIREMTYVHSVASDGVSYNDEEVPDRNDPWRVASGLPDNTALSLYYSRLSYVTDRHGERVATQSKPFGFSGRYFINGILRKGDEEDLKQDVSILVETMPSQNAEFMVKTRGDMHHPFLPNDSIVNLSETPSTPRHRSIFKRR